MFEDRILQTLMVRDREQSYRKRSIHCVEKTINFCSNDYLGLRNDPQIITAAKKAADLYGVGSGSAYLLSGYNYAHQALEEELANFLNVQRVLLFSSGYMANVGILSAILKKHDEIFADKYIHASLIDGCLLSKAKIFRYQHANLDQLRHLIEKASKNQKLIISEGLFGMDGTIANVNELILIRKQHNCLLLLDDAHGIGVLGKHGRGCLDYYAADSNEVTLLVGTLGKAFGSYGSFVGCSHNTAEFLIQTARTYLFTTALPPLLAEASRTSLRVIQQEPERREKLQFLIERFRKGALQLDITLMHTHNTPMQLILLGDNKRTRQISDQLAEYGLLVKPILPPTVPKNMARLRITLTATHTEQQIDYLVEKLAYVINKNS